ncbi:hypothetical protein amb3534 [Paramagnetospirillum magneticum AMB-1]|uniref:Uncharacterized protein n=2 Tax=Paramagnetospirillum magneticum TaxID=84159 RepID=Q2W1D7_PARM1|nr:hypothetical protein amb3534 [Paramagnetospirillum magneticum AMB-1]
MAHHPGGSTKGGALPMVSEIFADGVGRVDFVSGVVRIELVSLEPTESGQGKMEVRQRIAMPVDGFLHSLNTMGDLVNKLVEAGVLKRNEQTPGAAPAPVKA